MKYYVNNVGDKYLLLNSQETQLPGVSVVIYYKLQAIKNKEQFFDFINFNNNPIRAKTYDFSGSLNNLLYNIDDVINKIILKTPYTLTPYNTNTFVKHQNSAETFLVGLERYLHEKPANIDFQTVANEQLSKNIGTLKNTQSFRDSKIKKEESTEIKVTQEEFRENTINKLEQTQNRVLPKFKKLDVPIHLMKLRQIPYPSNYTPTKLKDNYMKYGVLFDNYYYIEFTNPSKDLEQVICPQNSDMMNIITQKITALSLPKKELKTSNILSNNYQISLLGSINYPTSFNFSITLDDNNVILDFLKNVSYLTSGFYVSTRHQSYFDINVYLFKDYFSNKTDLKKQASRIIKYKKCRIKEISSYNYNLKGGDPISVTVTMVCQSFQQIHTSPLTQSTLPDKTNYVEELEELIGS